MYDCLVKKFEIKELREKLLATGDEFLKEGNTWHDNCWGDCFCEKCSNIKGRNLLGETLMRVRNEIQKSITKKILVVVDMQNDFVTGSLGSADAVAIVSNVVKKINEYETNGDKIIFTKDTHGYLYLSTQEGKNLPVEHCIFGTKGWELIPELSKYENYRSPDMIKKDTFGSTYLAEYLRSIEELALSNGISLEIELIGLCTDICVVSNALLIKAHCLDAIVKVDASCCAGVTPEKHKAALETMKSCQINVINE